MKKIIVKGYCSRTWDRGYFQQVALLPCPYITYNPLGHFVETGIVTSLWVISINFLIWDFGFRIYKELK